MKTQDKTSIVERKTVGEIFQDLQIENYGQPVKPDIGFLAGETAIRFATQEIAIKVEVLNKEISRLKERLSDENKFYHSLEDFYRAQKVEIEALKKELNQESQARILAASMELKANERVKVLEQALKTIHEADERLLKAKIKKVKHFLK